jgi:hypothetical protein
MQELSATMHTWIRTCQQSVSCSQLPGSSLRLSVTLHWSSDWQWERNNRQLERRGTLGTSYGLHWQGFKQRRLCLTLQRRPIIKTMFQHTPIMNVQQQFRVSMIHATTMVSSQDWNGRNYFLSQKMYFFQKSLLRVTWNLYSAIAEWLGTRVFPWSTLLI